MGKLDSLHISLKVTEPTDSIEDFLYVPPQPNFCHPSLGKHLFLFLLFFLLLPFNMYLPGVRSVAGRGWAKPLWVILPSKPKIHQESGRGCCCRQWRRVARQILWLFRCGSWRMIPGARRLSGQLTGRGFMAALACSCISEPLQGWWQALCPHHKVQEPLPASAQCCPAQ